MVTYPDNDDVEASGAEKGAGEGASDGGGCWGHICTPSRQSSGMAARSANIIIQVSFSIHIS